ncbi:Protein tyrosine phosphatase [Klebsiella grimontii]|uniref:Protein tyrosine phosphatase n=1 Tax=Klebsiella grimontii TaxID=2058152 RepID=A0A7H4P0F8_9ENTR|nr:Protein tyrosine phosphatase [Klebsiella grimontii]
MFDSILVVCTGNICRSPIGERFLRRALPNKKLTQLAPEHLSIMKQILVLRKYLLSMD